MSAQVAAGMVFFADGTGVIRSLAPAGQLAQVTQFPLTSSQQMLSFAVSPDGTKLLATVFTIPPKSTSGGDPCTTGSPPFAPGSFTLDVYAAQSGSAARLLYHQDLGIFGNPQQQQVLAFIGWDKVGPEGTYPTAWATQGGGPHHYNGSPVRVDEVTGRVMAVVSDPNQCSVMDIASSGDFICVPGGTTNLSVRKPDGSELWRYEAPPDSEYYLEYLCPDEAHLLALGSTDEVIARNGTLTNVAGTFAGAAWLDSQTILGGGFGTNFSYIWLGAPSAVIDIGFTGLFVGTVRS